MLCYRVKISDYIKNIEKKIVCFICNFSLFFERTIEDSLNYVAHLYFDNYHKVWLLGELNIITEEHVNYLLSCYLVLRSNSPQAIGRVPC